MSSRRFAPNHRRIFPSIRLLIIFVLAFRNLQQSLVVENQHTSINGNSNSNGQWIPKLVPSENNRHTNCHWTVLAGDSNMRELFMLWKKVIEREHDRFSISSSPRIGSLPLKPNNVSVSINGWAVLKDGHDCAYRRRTDTDTLHRYADHEMVVHRITNRSSSSSTNDNDNEIPACHIVSQTFLLHQKGVERLLENMTNHDFCGTSLQEAVLPLGFQRPSTPDFIWFSHGFWSLPNEWGRNSSNLDCSTRFDSVVQGMQKWMHHPPNSPNSNAATAKVVWQTLFRINHHARITNEYIQWDRDCQLEMARKYGIPVFDLFKYLEPGDDIQPMDYHWTYQTTRNILKTILRQAFDGGQKNYFGKRVLQGKGLPFN
jgi:hypothetical protein